MVRRLGGVLFQVMLVATWASATAEPPGAGLSPHAVDSTVYLKVDRIFRNSVIPTGGTAFFVSPEGYLITNWHVVAPQVEIPWDGRRAEVSTTIGDVKAVINSGTRNERTVDARVIALNRTHDLALLWVPVRPETWLEVSDRDRVAITEPIWAVGYPFGDLVSLNKKNPEVTVVAGRVTSLRHDELGELAAIQIDAAVNPGNSGGPVLDHNGKVVGVVQSGIRGAATSLAVAPSLVHRFVQQHQVRIIVEPNAIWSRQTPLLVRAIPILRRLTNAECMAVLSGSDISPVRLLLPRKDQEYRATLTIPDSVEGLPSPSAYQLVLSCRGSGGDPEYSAEFSLPLREGASPRVESDREPASIMRDRAELANQAGSRHIRVEPPREGEDAPGPRTATSALSDLASSVRLRRESAEGTVDNTAIMAAIPALQSEKYSDLPTLAMKRLALQYDEALAACDEQERRRRAPGPVSGYTGRPRYDDYTALYQRCQQRQVLLQPITDAHMCRLESGEWIIRGPSAPHALCKP